MEYSQDRHSVRAKCSGIRFTTRLAKIIPGGGGPDTSVFATLICIKSPAWAAMTLRYKRGVNVKLAMK